MSEKFNYAITFDDAASLLVDKLREQGATVDQVFALCALLPALLPLCHESWKSVPFSIKDSK